MKLSKYEKETIIQFNEADQTASVYTYNNALKRQLIELCEAYPEQVHCTEDNDCGGLTFLLPKKWLKITPPRVLSPAQREALEQMNRKRWGIS
ncbi:hypothetical protein IMSAGC011_02731 [Lachnospiraceae bacterium]|nr:hypothetical protein IMSAGC011_02731 [Lachnospiraceae bacterium]